jgi:YVTN family beta-propeller protein
MGENVTEVVRAVRRQLRLREVGGPGHPFAGVDVPTVGIRIAVLVAQDAAVPPAFEKSACVDAVLPRAVAIKVVCALPKGRTMADTKSSRGMIAVDKMGTKVLFLNPATYETEVVLEDFPRTVHELLVVPDANLAYVPIFGDGIHGHNPNPGHLLCIIDLEKRAHAGDIDLRPYIAPHTLRLAPDGLIYITCENSAVVAVIDRSTQKVVDTIDSGSTNGHRLVISPDGQRLYTENEEDGTVSVIDLPRRKLLGKIKTPRPLAGIAISADGRILVAVDDAQPSLFLIDTEDGRITNEVRLEGVPKAAQIARYAPDNSLIGVTSLNSDMVSLIDPSFRQQTAIKVGSQPMDMAFRGDELFVACQGDGSVHVIDIPKRRAKHSFRAGTGCESLGFF